MFRTKPGCWWAILILVPRIPAAAQADNGIHVSAPKIYDSRSLTLMLEDLAQSLKKTSFIDPKALAAALGNTQGYSSQDFSQSLNLRGAVGPDAAKVVAGATGGAGAGLTAPALPSLQTPPPFTPSFGENSADLLSDEANLTYQLNNVRMLIERSLTDRLYNGKSRLQAVIGFDVDLEPGANAVDAAAIVDVTVTMGDCNGLKDCAAQERLDLVAVMPEEGSHNAATLSQKSNAFGGAIAANVFSVGYAAQKRSQVFYLYRDMDTLSYQKPATAVNSLTFGWQFRPVLGRRSVNAGMRHMMAVLALPASDASEQPGEPQLKVSVTTTWIPYQSKTQTTATKRAWLKPAAPGPGGYLARPVSVPTTHSLQNGLAPTIASVKWVPTDASTGITIVRGTNFFPGTRVSFGSKVYAGESDGLVVKSDHELEVAAPLTAAVAGGVLSGRYGAALPMEARPASLPASFYISGLRVYQEGADLYQVEIDLHFDKDVSIADLLQYTNLPVVLVKGAPIATPPFYSKSKGQTVELTAFIPSSGLLGGASTVAVVFPFAGPGWSASIPYYEPSVKVVRLGGSDTTRLLISVTDRTQDLCDTKWTLQLDQGKVFTPGRPSGATQLRCLDAKTHLLSLDIPTKDLKPYRKFALVHTGDPYFAPLVGDIPSAAPPPPGPSLDKTQKVSVNVGDVKTVTFTGTNLDQVTKALFVKEELTIVTKDAKSIVIMLSKDVSAKAGSFELQLLSDANDPILAPLTVAATSTPQAGK